ncbi:MULTISPECIES: four-carbon acid sugar kinase family protein [Marinomonas]|uniref:Four-carbon acid sugar kinase family protein n=1 Tax=Marinomonas rhodophyticola TaxID=2992803 RepID=A0ABT3KBF1_9GAMM|nr:four-carbon acid sugar kinase family protein [Marinomonas sp. KJ51-3]MCW4627862.1 hypothetical protein [Marinomonas sp. KJ51-3]
MTFKLEKKILIIADDLTGALDAAAAFCSSSTKVVVAISVGALESCLGGDAHVVAVSTQSREVSPAEAYRRVKAVIEGCPNRMIFKKIDSRLKGNVVVELDALPNAPLLVAPALPSFGRYVESGYVMGFGVDAPLSIKEALAHHAQRSIIPDCDSDAALDIAVQNLPDDGILVGARGLAFALARHLGIEAAETLSLKGSIGIVIGSTDPITLTQLQALPDDLVNIIAAPSGVVGEGQPDHRVTLLQATPGKKRTREEVGRNLAHSFRPLAEKCENIVLSGGATAEAVLSELGVTKLLLEGELLSGIPVSQANGWRIVTKSGGFGDSSSLLNIIIGNR